ncbi:protein tramtrack, alpha isoform isoform X2 [Procambarus clarkii]|uniref:protein tramtrack, alpha isoform isoform X2 n=1 Tax=Procambarus clarkii TaxID=6728 RepID=UPI001E67506B|nr:protein tramtrack, alpha isoform-like isoform X2 [Procambarus clarkii]
MFPFLIPHMVSSGVRMAMSPQQFCLRWNNHQSNIISVFEQLLQSESFVDVTLAVEGMTLKAHKVVLSACSPYFQAVLASHPDKHPIVILKDVRYTDMRDLLDFMYRGEVSVDQDNLSGFLRVAESLRIKGLTEVNEKKRLENSTSASSAYLVPQAMAGAAPPGVAPGVVPMAPLTPLAGDPPPLKRPPLSPSATYGAKRRRGRPPKISGEESEGEVGSVAGSLSAAEGEDTRSEAEVKVEVEEAKECPEPDDLTKEADTKSGESTPGPSGESQGKEATRLQQDDQENTRESPGSEWRVRMCRSRETSTVRPRPSPGPRALSRATSCGRDSTRGRPADPVCGRQPMSDQEGVCVSESVCSTGMDPLRSLPPMMPPTSNALVLPPGVSLLQSGVGLPGLGVGGGVGMGGMMGLGSGPSLTSSVSIDLPEPTVISAEEAASGVQMGIKVRGLDLMRYGRLEDGVYKCSECERIQIPKTFKTSYSFQRHAYLYHEGRPKRFPCPVCGKEFSRPDKRKSHLKEKHGLFQPDPSDQSEFPTSL